MKKIILFIGLFIIISLNFSFSLVKNSVINSNYELNSKIKNRIENETKGMDELRIARYSINLTSEILEFSEINDLKHNKANCVGYSMLCKSICEYSYKINNLNTKVFHIRGYVKNDFGFNICTILKNIVPKKYKNFVKDHDFIEIYSMNNTSYYLDPSSYDLIGDDNLTIIKK